MLRMVRVGEAIRARVGVKAMVLSSDHKWIIGGEHKWATVWDRKTRQRVLTVMEHSGSALPVDISSDLARFATGPVDRKVFI